MSWNLKFDSIVLRIQIPRTVLKVLDNAQLYSRKNNLFYYSINF